MTAGGFPTEAFDHLAAFESGNYWFESRNRLLAWALRRYFPHAAGLLEVGCGTGFVLQGLHEAFPALQLTGCELLPEGLAISRRRVPSATFFQMDARDLDREMQFDVVGAFDVLEHIDDDVSVLDRMQRAVRPGGGVMVTVPQHPALWSYADEYGHHVRRYRRVELLARMRHAGFDIVRSTSFVSLLLPLMVLSRRRTRTAESFDPSRELALPAGTNRFLRVILDAERAAIRAGVSWPVGGSLLVVGRKR